MDRNAPFYRGSDGACAEKGATIRPAWLRGQASESGRIAGPQGLEDRGVGKLGVEQGGLARQLWRRMRVRVGNQGVAIEVGDAPVHGRVGGKPGFEREDGRRQVAKAFLHRVEAGLGAEHRKPRRPDVGRNEQGLWIALRADGQDDFEQVARVQAQDGAAV